MSCRPRASLRFLVCAAALALAPLPGVTALSAQPDTLEIDLPAQPLGQSLNTLAQQAGVQIAAPGELVAGKQAPALKGRFTPQAALARLLVGSGLEARREGESTRVFTIDTRGRARFKTGPVGHTVVLGVDYQRLDNRDTGAFDFSAAVPPIDLFAPAYNVRYPVPAPTIRERFRAEQAGLYLQDQIKLYGLSALIGARHDWAWDRARDLLAGTETSSSDRAWTWRVGLTDLFDFGVAPYFSYATSFQPTGDVAFDGTPFVPTTGRQYELGLKYQPTGINAFVTVAAFDLQQENVLTSDPAHPGFSIQTGAVRSRGVELEGHASLTEGLDLVLAYTFLHQRVTESNDDDLNRRVAGMPTHTAAAWLDYTFRRGILKGLGLGAGVRYVGPTAGDSTNTFEVPSYTLVDMAVRYDLGALHPILKGGQAAVNVSNLLDKRYVSFCNSVCTFGLQRTVLGTLTYRW